MLPQEKEQMRQKLTAMAAELASQASQALGQRCGHPLSGVDPAPHRLQSCPLSNDNIAVAMTSTTLCACCHPAGDVVASSSVCLS